MFMICTCGQGSGFDLCNVPCKHLSITDYTTIIDDSLLHYCSMTGFINSLFAWLDQKVIRSRSTRVDLGFLLEVQTDTRSRVRFSIWCGCT